MNAPILWVNTIPECDICLVGWQVSTKHVPAVWQGVTVFSDGPTARRYNLCRMHRDIIGVGTGMHIKPLSEAPTQGPIPTHGEATPSGHYNYRVEKSGVHVFPQENGAYENAERATFWAMQQAKHFGLPVYVEGVRIC